MEFIVSAIASAVGSLGLEGVQSGYNKLRALLQGKFGEESALVEAVEQLEKNPDSPARKSVVAEELGKVGANKDQEIQSAAKHLLEQLEAIHASKNVFLHTGSGEQNIAQGENAIGKQVHTGSGDNVGRDKIIKE